MARASHGAVIADIAGNLSSNIDDLCDSMTDDRANDANKNARQEGLPAYAMQVQKGYRAYLRDLPSLLRAKREGYMVAYKGDERVGLSQSDRKLYQSMTKQPNYEAIKEELFITRVTILDAEEHGISV
jgi:hypothetical protein